MSLPASTALIQVNTDRGVLTGPGLEVTVLLRGLGPQSALAGTAKSLSASTASRAYNVCTNKSLPYSGCANFLSRLRLCTVKSLIAVKCD